MTSGVTTLDMSTRHPLISHLKETGVSLTDFARKAEMSRMQLYRIINGGNTTLDRLKKISELTGGKVTANDFASREAQQ